MFFINFSWSTPNFR